MHTQRVVVRYCSSLLHFTGLQMSNRFFKNDSGVLSWNVRLNLKNLDVEENNRLDSKSD